jgi:hypothetical protein
MKLRTRESHKQFKHGMKKEELPCRIRFVTSPSARFEALKNRQTLG